MKNILLILFLFCLVFNSLSQNIPHQISYQGKLYENGSPVNGTKNIRFTIGLWTETHYNVQITEGLYSVNLGEKNPIPTSLFENSSSVSLRVSVNGRNLSPETDIVSVPYAYKAEVANEAKNAFSGNYNDLQNKPTNFNDADANPSNEIQTLSLSGTQLSLSEGGGTVTLPSSGGGDNWGTQSVQHDATLTGDGTSSSQLGLAQQGASTGQVLKWNGSAWTPTADETGNSNMSLPYSELSYNGENHAFQIQHLGNSGNVADFEINNNNNPGHPLIIKNNGRGEALMIYNDGTNNAIRIENDINSKTALNINNDSYLDAVYINNASDSQYGIWLKNYSSYDALKINNYGTENAARISIDNQNNSENALTTFTNGSGNAIAAYTTGSGYAGYFNGNVNITGTLTKGTDAFKIDHPLDPENKYLYHSVVESPDMMNVYNGNIILDENGNAIVQLPDWFEALNMEFRYQLTCIGDFAPVFISKKITNNKFKISGGTQGLEISWQVTGIRNDPYAQKNRIQVEVEKPEEEKGKYLYE